MTVTEINQAFQDSEDGLMHWSATALEEAQRLVQQPIDFIERDYANARPELKQHYDDYRQQMALLRDHIIRCRNVPATNPA